MGVRPWIPRELLGGQPYSMGPLTRWSPPMPLGYTSAATGTVAVMDDRISTGGRPSGSEFAILGCLIAPRSVQREAQRAGIRAVMMIRPKGLAEALADMPVRPSKPARWIESDAETAVVADAESFMRALRDIEDDDD